MSESKKFILDNKVAFIPHLSSLRMDAKETALSQKEGAVLNLLCATPTTIVERAFIINSIWGDNAASDIGLNKAILGLRRKLESFGINDAIKTIPRVGYVLNIAVFQETIEPINSIDNEDHNKKTIPYFIIAIILGAVALSIITYRYFYNKSYEWMNYTKLEFTNNNTIYFGHTAPLSKIMTPEIKDLFKRLKNYRIFISKDAISALKKGDNRTSKLFLIDKKSPIYKQLSCVLRQDNRTANEDLKPNDLIGADVADIQVYSSCNDEAIYLGKISINTIANNDSSKSILQKYTLTSPKGNTIFAFDKISSMKVYHIGEEAGNYRAILHKTSMMTSEINNYEMVNCSACVLILKEFSREDVKTEVIDVKDYIQLSDSLGGYIFFDQRKRVYNYAE